MSKVERITEPEHTPTYTLDRDIDEARERMGEDRWLELNEQWEAPGEAE